MIKSVIGSVAALLFVAAPLVSAAEIKIDFEEFAYGTTIGNYYNHGSDSLGRSSGAYYGLTFGGTVKFTPLGAYLSRGWMTIDPTAVRSILGTDQYWVSFNAGRYDVDGGQAGVSFEDRTYDSITIAGNGNPFCGSLPGACDSPYIGIMGGYEVAGDSPTSEVTGIGFNADRVDNIVIHAGAPNGYNPPASILGTGETLRDIPEPASLSLLAIGAAGLLARRRRKSVL